MAIMKNTQLQKGGRKTLASALVALALAGSSSAQATSTDRPPVVGPQASPPQGMLTVYSERYVRWDGDVSVVERRPVELQTLEGQVVGTYTNPVGEGPLRLAVPPGHY